MIEPGLAGDYQESSPEAQLVERTELQDREDAEDLATEGTLRSEYSGASDQDIKGYGGGEDPTEEEDEGSSFEVIDSGTRTVDTGVKDEYVTSEGLRSVTIHGTMTPLPLSDAPLYDETLPNNAPHTLAEDMAGADEL